MVNGKGESKASQSLLAISHFPFPVSRREQESGGRPAAPAVCCPGMEPIDTSMMELQTGASGAKDYERVARAIEYLRRHAPNQPDLAAVASHVHLSEYHFQRLFTRWAGVSPKRFLQFLTVEHAKTRIAAARSALDLATDVGLSGPGPLHDLFVRLEAMSPGEFKSGGAGLRIGFRTYESPFGPCLIASTARGICALRFLERATGNRAQGRDPRLGSRARRQRARLTVNCAAQALFASQRSRFPDHKSPVTSHSK